MKLSDFGADISLPALSDEDCFVFRRSSFPSPPRQLVAPELHVVMGGHCYHPGNLTYPVVALCGPKGTFRGLGLVLLASVFHQAHQRIEIDVTNIDSVESTKTRVTQLRIQLDWGRRDEEPNAGQIIVDPIAYKYFPRSRRKWPWSGDEIPADLSHLPMAYFGDDEGFEVRSDRPAFVYGFGGIEGSIRIAELLLDVSQEGNAEFEFDLESEMGCRGVAPGSAEISINLPGSFRYEGWVPPE